MLDDLEHELGQLTPVPPSPALDERISRALSALPTLSSSIGPSSLHTSDRVLLATLSCAAAAAVLAITLLTLDFVNAPPSPPADLANNPTVPTFDDVQRLLAQLTGASDAYGNR